jgi:hypothetical protein
MYLIRNIKTLSRNHCCSGKSKIITYSECVSLVLHFRQAMSMSHIFMRRLPGSQIFFSTTAKFSKNFPERKICVLMFSTSVVRNIFHCGTNCARFDKMCLFVSILSARYSSPILKKFEFFLTDFLKLLKYQIQLISFYWEPSCSTQTDIKKLIVAFCSLFEQF